MGKLIQIFTCSCGAILLFNATAIYFGNFWSTQDLVSPKDPFFQIPATKIWCFVCVAEVTLAAVCFFLSEPHTAELMYHDLCCQFPWFAALFIRNGAMCGIQGVYGWSGCIFWYDWQPDRNGVDLGMCLFLHWSMRITLVGSQEKASKRFFEAHPVGRALSPFL